MKKLVLIIVMCLLSIVHLRAQPLDYHQIYLDLYKIAALKKEYEKYRSNRVIAKTDSLLIEYKNQVNKIKNAPDIYLSHINMALENPKAGLIESFLPYKYMPGSQYNLDFDCYYIKKIDYYRVVKFSLFKRDEELLPEDFRGLRVVDENNYKINKNSSYDFKPKELRSAIKFLLDSLSLTRKEKRDVRNSRNAKAVIEIKNYLDEKGLSSENKEFVKWAFKQLVLPNNNISLSMLEAMYEPNRNKKYIPKDKEPLNP